MRCPAIWSGTLRIAHIVNRLDPSEGGQPAIVARLAAAQQRAGHQVAIYFDTPRDPPATFAAAFGAISGFRNLALRHWGTGRRAVDRSFSSQARGAFEQSVRSYDFVHIHGAWHPALLQAANLCRGTSVPYCIAPHGMLSQWNRNRPRLLQQLAVAASWQRAFSSARFLHLTNVVEREQVRSLGLSTSEVVVPNGIDLEELDASSADSSGSFTKRLPRRFVLFCGRLHATKGLDVLCKAFARIAEHHPDLDLVIAGPDHGFRNDLVRFIGTLGLARRAHLLDPVYGSEKFALLKRAECFCAPSRQEGFSVTILEALGCGVPVVIARACNFVEVEERGAGFLTTVDPARVAEALDRLCGQPELLESSRVAAVRLVEERSTWGTVASELLHHYRSNLRAA